ncbi:hypothetical protein HDU76_005157 [Blyttiomyces sp. JEL0837]|nr:hypothetical protein HDU76_005157 [Blyttiomyces sp. JEL0837]
MVRRKYEEGEEVPPGGKAKRRREAHAELLRRQHPTNDRLKKVIRKVCHRWSLTFAMSGLPTAEVIPVEVLQRIFSYSRKKDLASVRCVSRFWSAVAGNCFWKTVIFTAKSTWPLYNLSQKNMLPPTILYAEVKITANDYAKLHGLPTDINATLQKCSNLKAVFVDRKMQNMDYLWDKLDHALLEPKETLALNMDGMQLDGDIFKLSLLRRLPQVSTVSITMTTDFNKFNYPPLYCLLSLLPRNVTKLGLLPVVQDHYDPPGLMEMDSKDVVFPHKSLNVEVLHITVIQYLWTINMDDAFKAKFLAFLRGFFPSLREVMVLCGDLSATYQLTSTWTSTSNISTFRPDQIYVTTLRGVAETVRGIWTTKYPGQREKKPNFRPR